jgi:thiol-disulfide isomerase/thioredoxin
MYWRAVTKSTSTSQRCPMLRKQGLWLGIWILSLCILNLSKLCPTAMGQSEQAAGANEPILLISGGGQFSGRPLAHKDPSQISWKSSAFPEPIDFPLDAVSSIRFPKGEPTVIGDGSLAFELLGGDLLLGKLVAITDRFVVIESLGQGELRFRRDQLVAIRSAVASGVNIYDGPGELASWTTSPASGGWAEGDTRDLISKSKNARLWRKMSMPRLARIELELAWRQKAGFVFEITKEVEAKPIVRNRAVTEAVRLPAYRLEVANSQLVAAREAAQTADVAPLGEVTPGEGELHLLLFVDQTKGIMSVCRPSGELIAKVEAKSAADELLPVIRFSTGQGDLRIVSLRIAPWSGAEPATMKSDLAAFTLTKDTSLSAKIVGYNSERSEWDILERERSRRIPAKDVQEIRFAVSQAPPASMSKFVLRSGMQISGQWKSINDAKAVITSSLLEQDLELNCSDLLAIYQKGAPAAPEEPKQRLGRLDAKGFVSSGWLVNHEMANGESTLGWQAKFANNSVPFPPQFSGKITYRELPAQPSPVPAATGAAARAAVRIRAGLPAAPATPSRTNASNKPMIYLRTGDMVTGEVVKIDGQGVEFKSTDTAATFLAHKDIRAVELISNVPPIGIPKAKKDRLLMLPRSQRENPPTHLVRSLKGDYLRCRIVAMDEENLDVEVRLESKRIPRNTVARIIWLDPPPSDLATTSEEPKRESTDLQFQSIPENRKRLTFAPQRVASYLLIGKSPILGECTIDLEETSVLLIGEAITTSGIPLAYDQWKLRPAPEPLAASETSGEEGGSDGLESVLVGKPAPPIELMMLDGKKFSLANRKSKVVVLDFWASWCGPCIQAMPHIHEVAAEFAADGVELVGVNLEESPERITATLKRLELDLAVALDTDGKVAMKYGASAIPQTVIIDAQGNVARVFVGGGPKLADQLRQALNAATGKTPVTETKQ